MVLVSFYKKKLLVVKNNSAYTTNYDNKARTSLTILLGIRERKGTLEKNHTIGS